MEFDKIQDKPYHFTLERRDPTNTNVPEVSIPENNSLYFQPNEMLELRRFYKEEGRNAPFELLQFYAPESFENDWWALLGFLYSQTSIDIIALETAASPNPVANKDAWLDAMLDELPYNVDDYYIIPPKELIDDVLDDNFTDWVDLMNRLDMDNAIIEAEADIYYPDKSN